MDKQTKIVKDCILCDHKTESDKKKDIKTKKSRNISTQKGRKNG